MADAITVYESAPSTPVPALAATAFLHVWLDTALNNAAARAVFCPRCHAPAAAVTVGRGEPPWFRVEPCTCLFSITGAAT